MDLLRTNRRGIQQIFSKMREISIRMSCRGDAFVHLRYMNVFPRGFFLGQSTQHDPRRSTAADRHHELTASSRGRTGFRGNEFRGRSRGGFVIGKHFNLHTGISAFDIQAAWPAMANVSRAQQSDSASLRAASLVHYVDAYAHFKAVPQNRQDVTTKRAICSTRSKRSARRCKPAGRRRVLELHSSRSGRSRLPADLRSRSKDK